MTEAEWLTARDAGPMLGFLRPGPARRKCLLFAVACCRRIEQHLLDERSREAVRVVEALADGLASEAELRTAATAAHAAAAGRHRERLDGTYTDRAAAYAACAAAQTANASEVWGQAGCIAPAGHIAASGTSHCVACAAKFIARSRRTSGRPAAKKERRRQADLLRDIVGDPFRPVALDPDWRTSTTVALARSMYESRDFAAMPVLADALEDAGCEDSDVLGHCRGPGPHVRDCWVVDLVLGKS